MLLEVIGYEEIRPIGTETDPAGRVTGLVPGETSHFLEVKFPGGRVKKIQVDEADVDLYLKELRRWECGCKPLPAYSIRIQKGCKIHDRGD